MSNDRVTIALAAMRLSLGVFFLVWALEKVFAPELAGKVATTFYGVAPSPGILRAIGIAQLVLIAAFMLGLFKTCTYGALLLIHTASVASTWQRLIDPFEAPNHLFWAGVPVVAMLFGLFVLRDADTRWVLNLGKTPPPGQPLSGDRR